MAVYNLFFLETAINTYVDDQGRHKFFDSETDLLYPPDEKRFRETLLESIDDASEFLNALQHSFAASGAHTRNRRRAV